ncbi:MAG: CHAT domain-containing protein [Cryomorphaceae bacterium]|nr:MAG: CHAT domain-containing protein [Cryomorphaceae bacterium]
MLKFPVFVLICFWSLFFHEINAQIEEVQHSARINQLLFSGQLVDAESEIQKLLADTSVSTAFQSELYTLRGFVYKIRGDVEQALVYWKKANALRNQLYKKGDYRLAWNYALLSSYHYEKIHHLQAKAFADSCRLLIQNLTTEQQLEIDIYRIWNILAQSDKLLATYDGYEYDKWHPVYSEVWRLYERSVEFQLAHQTPRHHLAKTYHLLGNAYQDMIGRGYQTPGKEQEGEQFFASANKYYNRALNIWAELYDDTHYEKALTHFVQAMSYWRVPIERQPEKYSASNKHFEKALNAWGISDSTNEELLRAIPNKIDLLMCLRVYSVNLIDVFHQTENPEYFDRLIQLNTIATSLWKIIHGEFTSKHINQYLATYHLIPYNLTYYLELEKQRLGRDFSLEKMFSANQRLKYFDLIKYSDGETRPKTHLSLQQLQQQLKPGECFLDLFLYLSKQNIVMAIFPDTVVTHSLPFPIRPRIKSLNASIINPDYNSYCENALSLYADMFGEIDFTGINKLYICPYGETNNIPFDALLCSDEGIDSKDYRKLDYFINRFETEYVLSSATFQSKPDTMPFSLALYAPAALANSSFSELPFSRQLAKTAEQQKWGKAFTDSVIDIAQLFNTPASVVHLSTHGLIEPDHSEYSELVLGHTRLRLNEVYQHKINSHLVVLNACNSSRGIVFTDDGVHGFTRAFFSAGARSVLSNLWEVDDKTSNRIMGEFYQHLRQGETSSSALRQAKHAHIAQAANSNQAAPYYWAGHWLVGRDIVFESEVLSEPFRFWQMAAVGLIVAITLGIWWRKR